MGGGITINGVTWREFECLFRSLIAWGSWLTLWEGKALGEGISAVGVVEMLVGSRVGLGLPRLCALSANVVWALRGLTHLNLEQLAISGLVWLAYSP